jgi:hypothetical protein
MGFVQNLPSIMIACLSKFNSSSFLMVKCPLQLLTYIASSILKNKIISCHLYEPESTCFWLLACHVLLHFSWRVTVIDSVSGNKIVNGEATPSHHFTENIMNKILEILQKIVLSWWNKIRNHVNGMLWGFKAYMDVLKIHEVPNKKDLIFLTQVFSKHIWLWNHFSVCT